MEGNPMTAETTLDKVVADQILEAVRSKFDLQSVSDVEIVAIEVDREEHKIRIELSITTSEPPEALAKSYFGLTGKVRSALGKDWHGFFPVITPQFNSNLHA
ncbi:hypothetical protein [Tritonibacter mobilis]|uniref:hypothetical protein n=1 Tax=Tritonibacter mobilis TaxID=379347 RepID=UPI00398FED85